MKNAGETPAVMLTSTTNGCRGKTECPKCKRMTLHQETDECMVVGCQSPQGGQVSVKRSNVG